MTAPSPGAQREDTALAVGATVGALMSTAQLAVLALLPPAMRRATGRAGSGIARRVRAQAAATLHQALTQADTAVDRAEDRITRDTLAALGEDALPAGLRARSWTGLKASLRGAVTNALDGFDDVLQRTLAAVAPGMSGVLEAQAILDELARHGLTAYTDPSGRSWSISSYSEMATRTAASRLALAVQLHVMAGRRLDLVMVDKTSAEPGCPLCRPYEWRVLSISGATRHGTAVSAVDSDGVLRFVHVRATLAEAVAHGLLHPSCRHFLAPFVDGIDMRVPLPSQRDTGASYEALQRRRTLERAVRRHADVAAVAVTPAARVRANRRLVAARGRLREHVGTYHHGKQAEPQVRAS